MESKKPLINVSPEQAERLMKLSPEDRGKVMKVVAKILKNRDDRILRERTSSQQQQPKTEPEPTGNLGTEGSFHSDRQTSQPIAAYLCDNGIRKQAQIRQLQKDIESKMDELAKLGIDIGDFRGELHKRLSAAHDAGQPEVRTPGSQGEATGGRGTRPNTPRRRFTLVRDDGDLKSPSHRLTLIEKPIQDDLFRQQLDIFLDSDPAGQPGPKAQAARREAVAAVESLRRDS